MNEKWKDVVGYEGKYEVSDKGNIRSVKRTITRSNGHKYWIKSTILRTSIHCSGYEIVTLYNNCKSETKRVHRLVAEAFHSNKDNKKCVNHKDGNKINNKLENLEWVTHSENLNHAYENKLRKNGSSIILIDEKNNERKFRSEVNASLFLGRSKGYLWTMLNRGHDVMTSIHGEKFVVKRVEDNANHKIRKNR